MLATSLHAASNSDQTIQNLNAAYRGESNAHQRYTQFAEKADKEGYIQVAKRFRATARAEEIHRESHRKTIGKLGGKVEAFTLDKVTVASTQDNLKAAIKGEIYERDTMYPAFLATAKADGSRKAAKTRQFALEVETEHAKLYTEALATLGKNAKADYYVCPVCGDTVTALPDKECPICGHDLTEYEKVS